MKPGYLGNTRRQPISRYGVLPRMIQPPVSPSKRAPVPCTAVRVVKYSGSSQNRSTLMVLNLHLFNCLRFSLKYSSQIPALCAKL